MGSQHFTLLPALLNPSKTADLKRVVQKAHYYKRISNQAGQLPFIGCFYYARDNYWLMDKNNHNNDMLVVYLFEGYEKLVTFRYPH